MAIRGESSLPLRAGGRGAFRVEYEMTYNLLSLLQSPLISPGHLGPPRHLLIEKGNSSGQSLKMVHTYFKHFFVT